MDYVWKRHEFPPAANRAQDIPAAKLELYNRYLLVEDNGRCGGLIGGLYVQVDLK
jgi:hypothetical protein